MTLALAWTVFNGAGVHVSDFMPAVFALAVVALILVFRTSNAPPLSRAIALPLVVLPLWVLVQLVPLPLDLLRVISPARAELALAIHPHAAAAISVTPAATFVEWLRAAGCVLLFVSMRVLAAVFSERHASWTPVFPLLAIVVLEAGLGIVQVYTGAAAAGAHGTYTNRDHFAGLLNLALPFPFAFGFRALARRSPDEDVAIRPVIVACLSFATAAFILIACILSLSRMGFIASLCALAIVAVFLLPARRWLLAIPVALLVLFVYLPPDELIARFADLSEPQGITFGDRVDVWRETVPMISAFPLTGCGLGAYESAFMRFKRSTPMLTDNFTHNDYLQYLVELGVPAYSLGIVLITALLVTALRTAISRQSASVRALGAASLAAITALLVHSIVDFNSYIPANALAFAWVAAMSSSQFYVKPSVAAAETTLEAKLAK